MAELDDREKTGPIVLLENRRKHLIGWIKDGEGKIAAAEQMITATRVETIAMLAEIDQIEIALNVLNAAQMESVNDG